MNSYELADLGNTLSKKLKDLKLQDDSLLMLNLDNTSLHKLDEDLYYRQFPDGKDFIPSDNEIKIKFENLLIMIKSDGKG